MMDGVSCFYTDVTDHEIMKKKRIYSKEVEGQIDSICRKLNNSITPLHISNWLTNFEINETEMALKVLSNIKHFSQNEILSEFSSILQQIIDQNKSENRFYITALGKYGKSGSSLIYTLVKSPSYSDNENKFKLLTHLKKLKAQGIKNNDFLIIVDDIIGSGESLIRFYKHNIKQQLVKENISLNIIVLTIAYMKDAETSVSKEIQNVIFYGTGYYKAFGYRNSVFGYPPKMLPIREFAYKYGIDLFQTINKDTKARISHPLGFNNSQSLVVFGHSSPNNTIPIIWSNKNGWHPIYPRSGQEKISQLKKFRDQTRHWLSIANKLGIIKNTEPTSQAFYQNIDYKIISVIRLKKMGSNDSTICQKIGITFTDLRNILDEGIKKNTFDDKDELTEYGNSIYDQIIKKMKSLNNYRRDRIIKRDINYVPKIFLGRT